MPTEWTQNHELVIAKVTPAIETGAYASGDLIGELLTLSSVLHKPSGVGLARRGGMIQHVLLMDAAKQDVAIDVVFFSANPAATTFTDNAALDIDDADLDKIIGVVSLTTYFDFADSAVAQALNLALPFVADESATDLYACLVARGAPTYAAATDIDLRVSILQV